MKFNLIFVSRSITGETDLCAYKQTIGSQENETPRKISCSSQNTVNWNQQTSGNKTKCELRVQKYICLIRNLSTADAAD